MDSVADYTTGLPFYEKAMGKGNAVMMPWVEHGFDMYSMSIIASEKTMKERPKVLRAFLEASYMGWRDVMEDPKSALEIFKKRVPEIDLSVIEPNMKMGLDLMKTDRYAQNGIGWMEEKKMCQSVDLVNTYMGVPTKVECKAVYTNEFLTRIELPKSMRCSAACPEVPGAARLRWARPRGFHRLDRVGMTYEARSGPVEALRDISFGVRPRRARGAGRPERLRQVHPAADRRRAAARHRRPRGGGRPPA